MKQNTCCKALLVLVLSLVMMLSLAVVSAAAVDANGDHVCDSTPCLVCDVAAKINALPDAANITVDNAAAVTEQIHAIDRVKMDLTDEQYDELLTVVATRPNGSGYGLDEPVRYMEAVEKVVSLNAGGSLYITKSYSVGSTQLDWAQTDAMLTIESLDAGSTFAPLSVTLSDIANLSALADYGLYSATADGWTNCYILPAGTYKITETGYNAVTASGATLTTIASYSVDGNAVSTDYAEVTVEEGENHVVSVLNQAQLGNLKVENHVNGTDAAFNFTVKLNTPINGLYGNMTFVDGVATFSLQDEEDMTATDIPVTTEFLVSVEEKAGYERTDRQGYEGTITDVQSVASFTFKELTPLSYNLWVGGTEVTEQNAHDVFGDGKVSYVPDTNTLTMNSVTLTATDAAIKANGDLNIALNDNNTITSTNDSGIEVTGAVTIVGGGTLRVSSTNGNGIEASDDINITGGTVSVTADDDHCGIVSLTSITIGGEDNPTVTVGCKVGLDAPIVTIKNSCTLTITSKECAIATAAPLNFPEGNWYQWKGDDDTLYRSGIGADDRLLTKEDGAANKSLKIEPIATEPNTHTVTLVNGDKVWHVFTGISDGQTLRVILTMPPPLEGGPAGSMFYRWYTESDEWIRHDTVINEDKVAYATWKQPIAGTVTFSGEPVVGQPITATATVTTAGVTTLNYQWLLGERRIPIDGATSATYTPTAADAGQLLICAVNNIEIVPGSIVAEAGIVKEGNSGGGYYPIYIPTAPQQSPELVTSPDTFDSGIATSVVLTLLAATGAAWLGKKKD